nr:flagellar biosynthetic protein FliO [uncultured Acetatifactor sp.]
MLLTGRINSYAQFVAVLAVFVLVLGLTALTTKWIAGYQRRQNMNCNIEVLETTRIGNNKYIQLVRIGETCWAIAVCKDTVTLLGEVPKEQLKEKGPGNAGPRFKELLEKAMKPKE